MSSFAVIVLNHWTRVGRGVTYVFALVCVGVGVRFGADTQVYPYIHNHSMKMVRHNNVFITFDDFHLTFIGDHNIGRFDVPVGDVFSMGGLQAGGDLGGVIQNIR